VDPTVTGNAVTCEAPSCAATVAALRIALGDALDAVLPSRFLSVYRTDGVMVQVGIDAQAAATPPAGLPKGATVPSLLSLEERALIANDPGLTVLS
jgi:hypothetical protein